MAKRISKGSTPKLPTDINQRMHALGKQSTEAGDTSKVAEVTQDEISRVMSALGQRGGKKGGKRRLETMSQKERSDVAYKAAQARWSKAKKA